MSRTTEKNVLNTDVGFYIDPAQESKLGLLILSKRINDLDVSLSSRLNALEATIASAESNDDEESISEICDEIAASEASRYHREEAERRKRRRELDLKLSKIRSKRAEAERKAAETAAKREELLSKFVTGMKAFVSSWTMKSTYKLLFVILTIVSMLMYFMCYSIVMGIVLIIPGILMIMPSYRSSRSQLMSRLDEDSRFLFSHFEGYIAMMGGANVIILMINGMITAFNL